MLKRLDTGSRKVRILIALLVFVLGMLCVGFDNGDVWFMDVHARDILENGFYGSVGRFTAHEGLAVPHQKWAMCMLVHLFVMFGEWAGIGAYHGLMLGSAVFCGLFALVLYGACKEPGHEIRAAAVSTGLTFLLSITGMSALLAFRPHIMAVCLCMIEIRLLERRFYGNSLSFTGLIIGLSACSLATMWFHSTMWPLCLVPVLPYLGEAVLDKLKGATWHRLGECLISIPFMILAGCLNPLGVGQFNYMRITSMAGSSEKYAFIDEMRPFWAVDFDFHIVLWLVICAVCAVIMIWDRKNVPVREWLFFLGSAFMSAVSVRLMLYFYAMAVPVAGRHLDAASVCLPNKARRLAAPVSLTACALLIFSFLPVRGEFREITPERYDRFVETVNLIQSDISGQPRIFCLRPGDASMFLWSGFSPVFDTRAEVYDGDLNGGYDVLSVINGAYARMLEVENIPWDYIMTEIYDRYDVDVIVFETDYLTEQLVDDLRNTDGMKIFVVEDDYVVCERLSSVNT